MMALRARVWTVALTITVCWASRSPAAEGTAGQQSSSAFSSPSVSNRQCTNVQVQFVQEKIGSASLVPEFPIHGKTETKERKEICAFFKAAFYFFFGLFLLKNFKQSADKFT